MTEDASGKILQALKASGILVSLKRQAVMGEAHDDARTDGFATTAVDVDQIISDITAKYAGLTAAEIGTIKARLQTMIHNGIKNRSELTAQAEQEASSYVQSDRQGLSPTQEIKRLALAIDEDDRKISGLLADMERDGVVFDPEKKRRLVELQAWVDAHPDDKSAAYYQEYVALQREMAQDGERQANDPHSGVTDRPHVQATAQKIHLTDEDRQKLQKELDEAKDKFSSQPKENERTLGQISEEDDGPNTVRSSGTPQSTTVEHSPLPEDSQAGPLPAPQFAGKKPAGISRSS